MKIKLTARINLKRLNHKYPSCHLVGRHLTFPVTTTRYIPWVEFVFPSLRFVPVIVATIRSTLTKVVNTSVASV